MDLTALAGRRLLVPVTAERRHLAQRLADAGAVIEEAEFIEIVPTEDTESLENATLAWCSGDFDWLVVTSRNALAAMQSIAKARGMSLGAPHPEALVATVGGGTRIACEDAGLTVSLMPEWRQNARGIVEEFPEGSGRVLAPLGNLAASVLSDGIAAKGWQVSTVEAYRTIDGAGVGRATREQLAEGEFDAVLLTSGSVARRFAATSPELPEHTLVIAIGDTTAATARAAGVNVSAVAAAPSYDGIVESLLQALDPDVAEVYDEDDIAVDAVVTEEAGAPDEVDSSEGTGIDELTDEDELESDDR